MVRSLKHCIAPSEAKSRNHAIRPESYLFPALQQAGSANEDLLFLRLARPISLLQLIDGSRNRSAKKFRIPFPDGSGPRREP